MAKIVVLGAGLGGMMAAFELRKTVGPDHDVTMISEADYFQFVPSNPWVLVGWRERKQITVDLEKPLRKKGIGLVVGKAETINAVEKSVRMPGGSDEAYDYLVVATGPELAFDEVEGLGPADNTHSVCQVDHAEVAAAAFERFCKAPGPVVIGAAQGASCFGPAYETAMIIETELRKRRIRDRVPMTFITPEPYIGHLGLDGVGDTKSLLESEMRDRHINWITNARIVRDAPVHCATSSENLNALALHHCESPSDSASSLASTLICRPSSITTLNSFALVNSLSNFELA